MKRIALGILAHVDAGKTTLSEGLLYSSGNLTKLGRVDKRDAFLDTHSLESIWNGKQYQRIRSIFYSGFLPNCCVNCGLIDTKRIKFLKILDKEKLHKEATFKKNIKERISSIKS